MPLNKPALKQRLNLLYDDQASRTTDPERARADFVDGLADAIEAFVKSATVTGSVTTLGSATTQAGPLINGALT